MQMPCILHHRKGHRTSATFKFQRRFSIKEDLSSGLQTVRTAHDHDTVAYKYAQVFYNIIIIIIVL